MKRTIWLPRNRNRDTGDMFLPSYKRKKEWEDMYLARMLLPTVRPPYVISVYEIRLQ